MNVDRRSFVGEVLTSVLLLFATVGCAPEGTEPIESLPWNNASIPASSSDAELPAGANADSLASANSGELLFRDQIVQKSLENLRIAAEPLVVQAVKTANDNGLQSQHQIDQTDLRWRRTKGTDDPLVRKYLHNRCADLLRRIQQKNANYVELFVMDNRGCIVAESDKTSDYWQGDEPKWIECFNGGNGRIHVGDVEYDQSSQLYVVQI